MKSVILILLIVLSSISNAQNNINPNGFNTFYHESGEVASEGYMVNGKPDGFWRTYYESGQVKSEGNRKDSELDSTWIFYSEEGIALKSIEYKAGKRNGFTSTFSSEGFLVSEENYVDDLKQGNSFTYYQDEEVQDKKLVRNKIPFVDGRETGRGIEYNKQGEIITLITFKNGFIQRTEKINRRDKKSRKQGVWKVFYEDESVQLEGPYLDDLKHGYFREYSKKGVLLNTYKYEHGKVVENAEELMNLEIVYEYYDNAAVRSVGTYKNGIKEGPWREFNPDGTIKTATIYRSGKMIGQGILDEKGIKQGFWKEYYFPIEKLKAEGEYKDGVRIKHWKFYYRNGQLAQNGNYNNKEKPNGKWVWFYESGELLREEYFRSGLEDGLLTEYNDTGKIITQGEFIDGLEEGEWVLEVGDHIEKGVFKDGQRYGEWVHTFTSSGKVSFEGEFIDGAPIGKHSYYFENGRTRLEGKYELGLKVGDWKRYNEEGEILVTIRYKDGVEKRVDGFKLKYKDKVKQP